jgi:hypothetical protein
MENSTILADQTCIYCRGSGVKFNREHVIPEAFGKFKDNFVLTCVCVNCNQFLGDELELVLGRNSREAILRLHHGVKAPAGATKLKYDRVELTVNEPGPWRGAQIILAPDPTGTKLDTRPVSQVGLRHKDQEDWTWISEAELAAPGVLDAYRNPESLIQVVGPSQNEVDRITANLKEMGIDFNQRGTLPHPAGADGTILTRLASRTDETILRAIGKIALNYVAYVHGPTFVLMSDFDSVRHWVRRGAPPAWGSPIIVVNTPILADDSLQWRQTNGHIVTVDWNRQGEGLFAQVSLFNDLNYKVLLCPKYSGLWHDLRSGHHFDLESHTISELRAASLSLSGTGRNLNSEP